MSSSINCKLLSGWKKIKEVRLMGHVTNKKKYGSAYRILIRKYESKKPVRTSWYRWENNFKMGIKEI
jgi:hypothetical protein